MLTHDAEGLLVPPKDAPKLAEALLSLAGDESRRQQMSQKGIITAQKYSWENVAKTVLACYREVLG